MAAIFLLVISAFALAAQPPTVALDQARNATQALGMELKKLLSEALSAQGYAGAVQACSQIAQQRTLAVAQQQGLAIRRVSKRSRNAASKPDDWESRLLLHWEQQTQKGIPLPNEVYETVKSNGHEELRYLKPIPVEAVCLGCHGERQSLAPGVPEKLKVLYPADTATGYHAGQLRGAISVRVPLQ